MLVSLGLISCKKKYAKLTLPEHVYTNISNLNKVKLDTKEELIIEEREETLLNIIKKINTNLLSTEHKNYMKLLNSNGDDIYYYELIFDLDEQLNNRELYLEINVSELNNDGPDYTYVKDNTFYYNFENEISIVKENLSDEYLSLFIQDRIAVQNRYMFNPNSFNDLLEVISLWINK